MTSSGRPRRAFLAGSAASLSAVTGCLGDDRQPPVRLGVVYGINRSPDPVTLDVTILRNGDTIREGRLRLPAKDSEGVGEKVLERTWPCRKARYVVEESIVGTDQSVTTKLGNWEDSTDVYVELHVFPDGGLSMLVSDSDDPCEGTTVGAVDTGPGTVSE